jgi:hypothetical protein
MAKKDADLFDRLRQVGLRKQVAKTLSGVSDNAGKQAQRASRASCLRTPLGRRRNRTAAPSRHAGVRLERGKKPSDVTRSCDDTA